MDTEITKPILFFCIRNPFCKRYYDNYVHKFYKNAQLIDLDLPESKKLQRDFNVEAFPTLILLDINNKQLMRWNAGTPPDMKKLQIELVLREHYG